MEWAEKNSTRRHISFSFELKKPKKKLRLSLLDAPRWLVPVALAVGLFSVASFAAKTIFVLLQTFILPGTSVCFVLFVKRRLLCRFLTFLSCTAT